MFSHVILIDLTSTFKQIEWKLSNDGCGWEFERKVCFIW